MSLTLDWPSQLDTRIVTSFNDGTVSGLPYASAPDRHIESGLAHIFFYGDTVYKLYKTHDDKDHFIKGVLAPTKRRTQYLEHDFAMNQHFGQGVYRERYSVRYRGGVVEVTTYDSHLPHVLYEMQRLDFSENLHERLLARGVNEQELYRLGEETARLQHNATITIPDDVTWFDQASRRVQFLRQFVAWLPEDIQTSFDAAACFNALERHLETNELEYRAISGNQLVPDLDNHDENIFFSEAGIHIIDVVPPMDCWWYGVPESNLTALMVNVETLLGEEAAQHIKAGYDDSTYTAPISENVYEFTRAFSYIISVAHFGSVPEKRDVALAYAARCADLPQRL